MTECSYCNLPAKVNHQLVWVKFDYKRDKKLGADWDFKNPDYGVCEENNFYCDGCWYLYCNNKIEELYEKLENKYKGL